ncbi:class I SAM-dependent methyltransferase [Micromonospora sp. NPDC048169]|uniref:class I SAM-dependent methyltransferase n=1 Tax=Micromonospora sp. NPDC048169 TaxID=3154711 RepID=UPI00340AF64A
MTGLETVLGTHPRVERAAVGDGVIYVVPADVRQPEFVTRWRRLYDDLYSADSEAAGHTSDFSGWTSSYTGELIPTDQMEQWRAATVRRVRAFKPSRVLEVGVGSGLLLWHLAPDCVEYRATDFSPVTIAKLRARLRSAGVPWASRVHLRAAEAVETDRFPEGYFDTVILNSVTMHFPGHGYLRRFIEQAMRVLAPGGRLFVGDNRNLSLLPQFLTEVQRTRDPAAPPAEIRDRVREAVVTQQWMLLAPEYFVATARELPDVVGVDIQLKRSSAVNELTSFRFDAVLHKGPAPVRSLAGVPRLRFGDLSDGADLTGLTRLLTERAGEDLRVTGIPNRALTALVAAAAAIERVEPVPSREAWGWLPEDLHLLAERLDRTVVVTASARPDEMDAVFLGTAAEQPLTDLYEVREPIESAAHYLNHPQAAELAEDIRRFVAERLPESDVAPVKVVSALPPAVELRLRDLGRHDGARR